MKTKNMSLRKQRLALLKQLETVRDLEKEEAKEARYLKFNDLKNRDARNIKISGLDSWFFRDGLSVTAHQTFEEYRKLCAIFDSALTDLKVYYNSHNHKNLIQEIMPRIENDDHLISRLINANEFKKD